MLVTELLQSYDKAKKAMHGIAFPGLSSIRN
jgi:hypothetical protein